MSAQTRQKGVTIIEFTVVSTFFLLVLFALIEMGVYLYSVQTLSDMTRRAARLGTVCHTTDQADISEIVTRGAPLGISAANIKIEYLDSDSNVVDMAGISDTSSSDYSNAFSSIRYVRASVADFQFHFSGMLSLLGENGVVSMPALVTTLPAESLGILRPLSGSTADRKTNCE